MLTLPPLMTAEHVIAMSFFQKLLITGETKRRGQKQKVIYNLGKILKKMWQG